MQITGFISSRKVTVRHLSGKGEVARSFPEDVRAEIIRAAGRYTKSFNFVTVDTRYPFSAGEGERYTLVYGNHIGNIEMVAEHNLGAGGLDGRIGASIVAPVGSFLIRVSGGYGGYFMDVYNIQEARVEPNEPVVALPAVVTVEAVMAEYNVDCPLCRMGRDHTQDQHMIAMRHAYRLRPE